MIRGVLYIFAIHVDTLKKKAVAIEIVKVVRRT